MSQSRWSIPSETTVDKSVPIGALVLPKFDAKQQWKQLSKTTEGEYWAPPESDSKPDEAMIRESLANLIKAGQVEAMRFIRNEDGTSVPVVECVKDFDWPQNLTTVILFAKHNKRARWTAILHLQAAQHALLPVSDSKKQPCLLYTPHPSRKGATWLPVVSKERLHQAACTNIVDEDVDAGLLYVPHNWMESVSGGFAKESDAKSFLLSPATVRIVTPHTDYIFNTTLDFSAASLVDGEFIGGYTIINLEGHNNDLAVNRIGPGMSSSPVYIQSQDQEQVLGIVFGGEDDSAGSAVYIEPIWKVAAKLACEPTMISPTSARVDMSKPLIGGNSVCIHQVKDIPDDNKDPDDLRLFLRYMHILSRLYGQFVRLCYNKSNSQVFIELRSHRQALYFARSVTKVLEYDVKVSVVAQSEFDKQLKLPGTAEYDSSMKAKPSTASTASIEHGSTKPLSSASVAPKKP